MAAESSYGRTSVKSHRLDGATRRMAETVTIRKQKKLEGTLKRRLSSSQALSPPLSPITPSRLGDMREVLLAGGPRDRLTQICSDLSRMLQSGSFATPSALLGSDTENARLLLLQIASLVVSDQQIVQSACLEAIGFLLSSDPSTAGQAQTPNWTATVCRDTDIVTNLINLLHTSRRPNVCELAAYALGNITGDSTGTRDTCLQKGLIDALLHRLNDSPSQALIGHAAWIFCNVCRGNPPSDFTKLQPAFSMFADLFSRTEAQKAVRDIGWAFAHLTDPHRSRAQEARLNGFIELGIIERSVDVLSSSAHTDTAKLPALRILNHVLALGSPRQAEEIIAAGGLRPLTDMLRSSTAMLRRDAAWAFANLCTGPSSSVEAMIEVGALDILIERATRDELRIKLEITWVFANALAAINPLKLSLIGTRRGFIQALGSLLEVADHQVLIVVLDALYKLLCLTEQYKNKTSVGVQAYVAEAHKHNIGENLSRLVFHENHRISEDAAELYTKYFDPIKARNTVAEVAPRTSEHSFIFAADD